MGGILIFALFGYLYMGADKEGMGIFLSITCALASFFILYGLTMPKKEIILDRQTGLFTYPGFMWGKTFTIPFKDAVVNIGSVGMPPGLILAAYHPNGFTQTTLSGYKQIQTWNLFVWYMDKNRPLPPGTAFDPYRQKDFERRKAEGFSAPLYESVISTPEATPDQQRERDKYWRSDAEFLDTKPSSILPHGHGSQIKSR